MNSLRSRLILGSSLIAIVPLAVAMVVLAWRIEAMVRTQASERLSATLGSLRVRLDADRRRVDEQLEILARDPQLRRLHLVRSAGSRELSDYLAERQRLLSLDVLRVTDATGLVVADANGPAGEARAAGGLAVLGSAPIRYQHEPVGTVQGGRVLDHAFLARLKETSGIDLFLQSGGAVVATTLAGPVPARAAASAGDAAERVTIGRRGYLARGAVLEVGSAPQVRITGLVSTAAADQTIAALRLTSIALGGLGVAIAILLGSLWSSQVSRPVERLAAFSGRLARGDWDQPLALRSVRELETLATALERMRTDLKDYRERLVVSERQAAWSRIAREVAHEIKNPLTPIAVSVADLKRSFDQRRDDFPQILDQAVRTIGEEVDRLRRLVQAFAEYGRVPAPEPAPCGLASLLDALETLYRAEVVAGRLAIARPPRDVTFTADAGQVRQALINLVQNGVEAVNGSGRVTLGACVRDQTLELTVSDDGPGLSDERRAHLFDPGFTTKPHGSGLGLAIVARIVSDHRGTIAVENAAGGGTVFRIRLPLAPAPAVPAAT